MKLAALSHPDELKEYFGKGQMWNYGEWNDKGEFEGESSSFTVKLKPVTIIYEVNIQAIDDPMDSESISTEDPIRALIDFMKEDLPGGEYFEKMSNNPDSYSKLLIELSKNPNHKLIRKATVLLDIMGMVPEIRMASAIVSGKEKGSLDSLKSRMQSKGWDVFEDKENGRPVLRVDISGLYEATIEYESSLYEYSFGVKGVDLVREGVTDDPITEFVDFYRDESVESVRKEKEELEIAKTIPSAP